MKYVVNVTFAYRCKAEAKGIMNTWYPHTKTKCQYLVLNNSLEQKVCENITYNDIDVKTLHLVLFILYVNSKLSYRCS